MTKQIIINRRRPSFLDSSLRLNGISAILESLYDGELTFTQLFIDSNIKFKKSFLKYLHYCEDKQFITRKMGVSKIPNRWEGRPVKYSTITHKGREFLEMIK